MGYQSTDKKEREGQDLVYEGEVNPALVLETATDLLVMHEEIGLLQQLVDYLLSEGVVHVVLEQVIQQRSRDVTFHASWEVARNCSYPLLHSQLDWPLHGQFNRPHSMEGGAAVVLPAAARQERRASEGVVAQSQEPQTSQPHSTQAYVGDYGGGVNAVAPTGHGRHAVYQNQQRLPGVHSAHEDIHVRVAQGIGLAGQSGAGSRVPVSAAMGSHTVGLAPQQGGFAGQPRAEHPNSAYYQQLPISAQQDDVYQPPPYSSQAYPQPSEPDATIYQNLPAVQPKPGGQPMSENNTYQNLQEVIDQPPQDRPQGSTPFPREERTENDNSQPPEHLDDITVTQQMKKLFNDFPDLVGHQRKPTSDSAKELRVRACSLEEDLYGDDNQPTAESTPKRSTADVAASPRSEQCSFDPSSNLPPPELQLLASTPASEYESGNLAHFIDTRSGGGSGRLSPLEEQPHGLGDFPDPLATDEQPTEMSEVMSSVENTRNYYRTSSKARSASDDSKASSVDLYSSGTLQMLDQAMRMKERDDQRQYPSSRATPHTQGAGYGTPPLAERPGHPLLQVQTSQDETARPIESDAKFHIGPDTSQPPPSPPVPKPRRPRPEGKSQSFDVLDSEQQEGEGGKKTHRGMKGSMSNSNVQHSYRDRDQNLHKPTPRPRSRSPSRSPPGSPSLSQRDSSTQTSITCQTATPSSPRATPHTQSASNAPRDTGTRAPRKEEVVVGIAPEVASKLGYVKDLSSLSNSSKSKPEELVSQDKTLTSHSSDSKAEEPGSGQPSTSSAVTATAATKSREPSSQTCNPLTSSKTYASVAGSTAIAKSVDKCDPRESNLDQGHQSRRKPSEERASLQKQDHVECPEPRERSFAVSEKSSPHIKKSLNPETAAKEVSRGLEDTLSEIEKKYNVVLSDTWTCSYCTNLVRASSEICDVCGRDKHEKLATDV